MIKGWQSLARLDRNLKLALLANLCIGFSFVGISSLLFNLFLAGLNFDPVFIGNLNGIGLLAFTLSALPSGILGARFGLRGTAMAGDFISGLGMAGFLLSALLPHEVWQTSMMVTLGIAYAGGAMGMVNLISYVMNVAPEDQRQAAFTFLGTFMALGAMVGALAGGLLPGLIIQLGKGALDQTTAYYWVLWLVAAGYLGAGLALRTARSAKPVHSGSPAGAEEEIAPAEKARAEKAPAGTLIFLGVMFIVQFFSEGSFSTFLTLYISTQLAVPVAFIGAFNAAYNPLIILSAPLLLMLLKRLGAGRTLTYSYIVIGACALVVAFFRLPAIVFPTAFVCALAMNFTGAARNLFGQEAVAAQWRPIASAITSISWSLGTAIAALSGGRIIAGAGYQALFLASAAAAGVAMLFYGLYARVRVQRLVDAVVVPE